MKPSFTLSVPNPCSEDWNSFAPTPSGGFCDRCQKNVIDFTKATDDEIIAFIRKKPAHACGRFRSDQLKTYVLSPPQKIKPGFLLFKAGVAGLLLLLTSKPSFAQIEQNRAFKETLQFSATRTKEDKSVKEKTTIRGKVISATDGNPLPGISVVQRGTSNATQTDGNGAFTLDVNLSSGNVLVFSFISLVTKELTITKSTEVIEVEMEDELYYLGGAGETIVIAGQVGSFKIYEEKPRALKRFWKKITGWL